MPQTKLLAEKMIQALKELDLLLKLPTKLIVGGGSAMILAHGFPLSTYDIDAIPTDLDFAALDPFVKEVAKKLDLPGDWLNPWFSTFTHTLPPDYGSRLIEVFGGKKLKALALGKDEMLIMKCFAARQKDVGHAKDLIKKGANIQFVQKHLESLAQRNIPGSEKAMDFLEDVRDQLL